MNQDTPCFYRRNLPHWQPAGAMIFLTWRLSGSLPQTAIERLQSERERLLAQPPHPGESPRDKMLRAGKALFALADAALADALKSGHGPRWLGEARIATLVQSSLHYWDGTRYRLHRYVIMPNHVHVLLEPLEVGQPFQAASGAQVKADTLAKAPVPQILHAKAGKPVPQQPKYVPLRNITQGLKGYTAREANKLLGRKGDFWQDEGFDHWIRDQNGYERCAEYIDPNPVEAGLCASPEDWLWGSVGQPFQAASGAAQVEADAQAGKPVPHSHNI
jgi:REP element-mobilizing transposase RayT